MSGFPKGTVVGSLVSDSGEAHVVRTGSVVTMGDLQLSPVWDSGGADLVVRVAAGARVTALGRLRAGAFLLAPGASLVANGRSWRFEPVASAPVEGARACDLCLGALDREPGRLCLGGPAEAVGRTICPACADDLQGA